MHFKVKFVILACLLLAPWIYLLSVENDQAVGYIASHNITTARVADGYCSTGFIQIKYNNVTCWSFRTVQHCNTNKDASHNAVFSELVYNWPTNKQVNILAYNSSCRDEYLFLNNHFWATISCIVYYIVLILVVIAKLSYLYFKAYKFAE